MMIVRHYPIRKRDKTVNWKRKRDELWIGTYVLRDYARSEKHIAELKECGIDFVAGEHLDPAALDLCARYGVGVIQSGVVPGWWGGNGDRAGKMSECNPIGAYEEAAKRFTDHPAILGIDAGDEPSALDFPYYGKVIRRMEELFPEKLIYLNLYPDYASVVQNTEEETKRQLGTETYREYVARYCDAVKTGYLCLDFYLYPEAGLSRMIDTFRTAADACRETGRAMWTVLQVNSPDPDLWLTENMLRFQANLAMAYGTEVITWACYTAGWWYHQVLDDRGEKTEQYDKLRRVNAELRALSPAYMKYRRTETRLIGSAPFEELARSGAPVADRLDGDTVLAMKTADGSPIAVGEMTARDGSGSRAFFAAACGDYRDRENRTYDLTFRLNGPDRQVTVRDGSGILPAARDVWGVFHVPLSSCGGVLIELGPR